MLVEIILFSFICSKVSADCEKTLTTVSGTHAPKGKLCSGSLIFEDNFDKFRLDIWQHEITLGGGSGNNQFQWYTNNRSNSYVEKGILHITPTLTAEDYDDEFLYSGTIDLNVDGCTNLKYDGCKRTGSDAVILNPIKSARMISANSFAFKYGKVEASIKAPIGDWLWPALWMKPRWNDYSYWPSSGEIDIMELRGNKNLYKNKINIGVEQVGATLHWGPNSQYNKYEYTNFAKHNPNGWHSTYFLYELYWSPHNITFLIDGQVTGTVIPPEGGFWDLGHLDESGLDNPWKRGTKMAPFDGEFYFLINMAVGSTTFFSDLAQNEPYKKPRKNSEGRASMTSFWKAKDLWLPTWNITTDDSHFKIDYIKVYAL